MARTPVYSKTSELLGSMARNQRFGDAPFKVAMLPRVPMQVPPRGKMIDMSEVVGHTFTVQLIDDSYYLLLDGDADKVKNFLIRV